MRRKENLTSLASAAGAFLVLVRSSISRGALHLPAAASFSWSLAPRPALTRGRSLPPPSPWELSAKKRATKKAKGRRPPPNSGRGFGTETKEPPPPHPAPDSAAAIADAARGPAGSPIHDPLLRWLRSHPDTYISPKLSVGPSDLGGCGAFASPTLPPFEPGEAICRLPRELCVTHDDALNDPLCGEAFREIRETRMPSWGMVLIAGWIAKERMLMNVHEDGAPKGSEIKHQAYLDSVPWERGELGQDHVLFWSDEEVEEVLGETPAHADATLIRETAERTTALLRDLVVPTVSRERYGDVIESNVLEGLGRELDRTVRGAFVIALSRSFAEEVELDDGAVEVENLLLPLIDVLQHSNDPNTMLESYEDCVLLRARRRIDPGEELFHRYREEDEDVIPAHKWFTRYGFIPGTRDPIAKLR
ncbi:hypothetical protein ACHAWF_015177 [Thalassiosira exigua]